MMSPNDRGAARGTRRLALVAAIATIALFAAACGSDDDSGTTEVSAAPEDPVAAAEARVATAESDVTAAQDALTAAGEQACSDATAYVEILDRYGKLFTDDAATVGDVKTLGADLVAPARRLSRPPQSVRRTRCRSPRPNRNWSTPGRARRRDCHRLEPADQHDDSRSRQPRRPLCRRPRSTACSRPRTSWPRPRRASPTSRRWPRRQPSTTLPPSHFRSHG